MKNLIKNNLHIIVLSLIAVLICALNYVPGTILSGWDTLHPEFNFGLWFERELLGVFRSYQGLGAVAAHSDMADLPRMIVIFVFGLALPQDFLRYSYIFLTLIAGPIGMYFFLNKHILKDKSSSFLGGLFYLLNLGTLQKFVVPFEMFVTQYATLPWLFLFATSYIYDDRHRKRNIVLFAIATFLAAPQAYAATLWYVYFISLSMFLFVLSSYGFFAKNFTYLKRAVGLIVLTLLINSFWILPNIYYIINHAKDVPLANINKLFSHQAFLYNKEFGNLKDISFIKSFLFDWSVYAGNNSFSQLLTVWITHLKQPYIQLIGVIFAITTLSGFIYSFVNKNKMLIALTPTLMLALFFLFNDNPPTAPLFNFVSEHFAFFKEAYRFPQDKVLIIYTFLFALYFATGQYLISKLISSFKQKLQILQVIIFSFLVFYFMLPAFKGELISPYMKTKIPNIYYEMFEWFDEKDKNARVANLPINSFWGWDYYSWNLNNLPSFQGAGFIWFGIKQPVLARDFDRWDPKNEQYYREMSQAIYSQDDSALKSTLEKYNIQYILLDKNIIAPPNPSKTLLHEETQRLLENQNYIKIAKKFSDTLIVYEVGKNTNNSQYIIEHPYKVFNHSKVFYKDFIFNNHGSYIIEASGSKYPFLELTDNQNKILKELADLTEQGIELSVPKNIKINKNKGFTTTSYLDTQNIIPSDIIIEKNDEILKIIFYPKFPIPDENKPSLPITTELYFSEVEPLILSINKKYNFLINNTVQNTPLSLGTVYLNSSSQNTVSVYPARPDRELNFELLPDTYYLEPCRIKPGKNVFGVNLDLGQNNNKNNFEVFGKNVSLCMTIPFSNIISSIDNRESLMTINFDYTSNIPLNFCVARLANGACQGYESNNSSVFSETDNFFHFFGVENQDLEKFGIQFRLDTSLSEKIEKAQYKNLSFAITNPRLTRKFEGALLKDLIESNMPIANNFNYITLPFWGEQDLSADLTNFPKTTGDCSRQFNLNPGLAEKQILEAETGLQNIGEFIRYTSEENATCDHFSYLSLPQDQGYVIAVTSRNIEGLPLTICVLNHVSKHCDIYSTLSTSKNFSTELFLLPPGIKGQHGYDINFRNLGIKKSPAVNDLKSIKIIPFPYTWISQISQSSSNTGNTEDSVLVLPQTFETGWKAYRIQNSGSEIQNWINATFPYLLGAELKDHVLVNNWANGWKIEKSNQRTKNTEYKFVFFPQYLEFLGFILLGGAIIYIIRLRGD